MVSVVARHNLLKKGSIENTIGTERSYRTLGKIIRKCRETQEFVGSLQDNAEALFTQLIRLFIEARTLNASSKSLSWEKKTPLLSIQLAEKVSHKEKPGEFPVLDLAVVSQILQQLTVPDFVARAVRSKLGKVEMTYSHVVLNANGWHENGGNWVYPTVRQDHRAQFVVHLDFVRASDGSRIPFQNITFTGDAPLRKWTVSGKDNVQRDVREIDQFRVSKLSIPEAEFLKKQWPTVKSGSENSDLNTLIDLNRSLPMWTDDEKQAQAELCASLLLCFGSLTIPSEDLQQRFSTAIQKGLVVGGEFNQATFQAQLTDLIKEIVADIKLAKSSGKLTALQQKMKVVTDNWIWVSQNTQVHQQRDKSGPSKTPVISRL
eukprot:TRINITY_DN9555_c0_g1_i3.p1 TRINITY_DN9555_c0_g1~~TRINITY_DN9555_c0_g1_i3.p1  ORF type:complete len:375 (-),score=92.60 TRINITY_DN9555_c0_g1_i3:76-1200(-)